MLVATGWHGSILACHHEPIESTPLYPIAAVPCDFAFDAGIHKPVLGAGHSRAGASCELEVNRRATTSGADPQPTATHPDHQAYADAGRPEHHDVHCEHDAVIF